MRTAVVPVFGCANANSNRMRPSGARFRSKNSFTPAVRDNGNEANA
jgi:hypothetical protein